ncbi:hypothetical protein ACWDTI_04600 [Gordonia sp. NPDC003424]
MMITTAHDTVTFACPDVHEDAELFIEFIRTLRMPGDDTTNIAVPGIGSLNVIAAGACRRPAPQHWHADDVVLPLWQSEAATINFAAGYPFLVRVGVDDINAITGTPLASAPDFTAVDHLEMHTQSRVTGYRTADGAIRQFVPGRLYSGGSDGLDRSVIRIEVTPLHRDVWQQRLDAARSMNVSPVNLDDDVSAEPAANWDVDHRAVCVVRLVNSAQWLDLTRTDPPHPPLLRGAYRRRNAPWFEWYDDESPIQHVGAEPMTVSE